MKAKEIKYLVGIYAASMNIMGILVPTSILGAVAQSFPNVSVSVVQMIVAIPSLLAIAANFLFASLSSKLYRKTSILIGSALFICGGLIPYFFHVSIVPLLVSACICGFAMGAVQNGTGAIVTDVFEGDVRGTVFGLFSVFVGLGAVPLQLAAGTLAAGGEWWRAYLAFLILVPEFILEIICLPKGNKEEAPSKTHRVKVPREVIIIGAIGFCYFALTQLFNSNVAMLVSGRGLGTTAETSQATSLYSLAGMIGGLLVFPWKKLFKNQTLSVNTVISTVGCLALAIAASMLHVFAGAILMSLAYAIYNPIECQFASEASEPMGMAFNLAIITATQSLGQALSPAIFGAITSPFGGTAASQYAVGAALFGILAIVTFVYFAKFYKPTQVAATEPNE